MSRVPAGFGYLTISSSRIRFHLFSVFKRAASSERRFCPPPPFNDPVPVKGLHWRILSAGLAGSPI